MTNDKMTDDEGPALVKPLELEPERRRGKRRTNPKMTNDKMTDDEGAKRW